MCPAAQSCGRYASRGTHLPSELGGNYPTVEGQVHGADQGLEDKSRGSGILLAPGQEPSPAQRRRLLSRGQVQVRRGPPSFQVK